MVENRKESSHNFSDIYNENFQTFYFKKHIAIILCFNLLFILIGKIQIKKLYNFIYLSVYRYIKEFNIHIRYNIKLQVSQIQLQPYTYRNTRQRYRNPIFKNNPKIDFNSQTKYNARNV